MPRVHELHDGLPHLLLSRRRRRGVALGRRRDTDARMGELLQSGAQLGRGRGRTDHARLALSPVVDAQVRIVDRPVRHVRVRGLRAVHHVVPGGHRRHRGDRGDPHHRRRGGGDDLVSAGSASARPRRASDADRRDRSGSCPRRPSPRRSGPRGETATARATRSNPGSSTCCTCSASARSRSRSAQIRRTRSGSVTRSASSGA